MRFVKDYFIDACTSSIEAGDNTLALKFLEKQTVKDSLSVKSCGALLRSLLLHPTADITNLDLLKDTQTLVDKLLSLYPAVDVIKAQDEEGTSPILFLCINKKNI